MLKYFSYRNSILLLMLGLGVGLGLKKQKSSPERKIASVMSELTSALPQVSNQSLRLNVKKGQEVFTVDRELTADLIVDDSSQVSPLKNLVDLHYRGKLYVEWQKNAQKHQNSHLAHFSFEIENPKVESHFYIEAEYSDDFKLKNFRSPVVKTRDEQEKISLLKDLISLYSFYANEDTTGAYAAKFETDSEASPRKIVKHKLQYLSPDRSSIAVLNSVHTLWLEPKTQMILKIEGEEETEIKSEQHAKIRAQSHYLLTRSHEGYAPPSPMVGLGMQEDQLVLKNQQTTPEHLSWKSIEARLHQGISQNGKERLEFFHEVEKAMKDDSEAILSLKNWILSHPDSNSVSFGVGALATEGSPEAQKTLIDLFHQYLNDPAGKENCHLILNALTTTEANLIPATRQLIAEVMDQKDDPDLATDASFTAGSALKKENDPVLEQKIDALVASATQTSSRLAALDAVGNSGDAHFLPFLVQSLNSSDEVVRERAAFALRYVQSEATLPLIETAMNDPALGVNLAGVKAIQYQQNIKGYASVINACIGKSNADSRLTALCAQVQSQM